MTEKTPKLAGVVGWPVGQSLSPLIHTIWASRAGIDGYYIPLAVPPAYDEFARVMTALQTIGFSGVNVTIPHKEHALRYADAASEIAQKIGAANMLTFGKKGVYADNSDAAGFEKSLRDRLGASSERKSAFILGAGGAARAVAVAIRNCGFADIVVANRTRDKAETIAADFAMEVADWEERNERLSAASFVVNTTSLGMSGQPPLELDSKKLRPGAIVADIVYSPPETPFLKAAQVRGHPVINGLDMLMHQAAPGFRQWFGGAAVVDEALRAALVTALKRRGSA